MFEESLRIWPEIIPVAPDLDNTSEGTGLLH